MRERTVLTEDGTGQWKLVVSLPGGRNQLSLDDGAVTLLRDHLGFGVGNVVPDALVPVLVATRDARLPGEKDTEALVEAVPSGGSLSDRQCGVLVDHLTSIRISPRNAGLLEQVVADSPVADAVDPSDLTVAEPPRDPEGIESSGGIDDDTANGVQNEGTNEAEDEVTSGAEKGSASGTSPETAARDQPGQSATDDRSEQQARDDPERPASDDPSGQSTGGASEPRDPDQIPGIGETRAESLAAGGFTSVREVAEVEPADVAEVAGLSGDMARVAVEGARELLGQEPSTAGRLASNTGVDADTFEATLSALAASGVPPSEAAPVLERLYGPSLAEVEGVSGKQAYYLWEAGYRTPADLATADPESLQEVPYVGAKTAPAIVEAAMEATVDREPREGSREG
jgi:predicted flap endonuclease-1-like 5' DNA nuclease